MLKRFWSIFIVTIAVLLSSSTHVSAQTRRAIDPFQSFSEQSNLVVRPHRGALLPATPVQEGSTSEPGDDDAPNKDEGDSPVLDGGKGIGSIRLWSFKSLGTGIYLHLLKYLSALR